MKVKKLLSLLVAVSLVCLCLPACGEKEQTPEDPDAIVVKYDRNLTGTGLTETNVTSLKNDEITLKKGEKLVKFPLTVKSDAANPKRLGFKGWCTDPGGKNEWNFADGVTESMTLYANWEKLFLVSYHLSGAVVQESTVFGGECPERKDGFAGFHKLLGWYGDANYLLEYDFGAPIYENIDIYMKTSEGIYLGPEKLATFDKAYGDASVEHGETTFEVVGSGEDAYFKVHFGEISNTSYLHSPQINEELVVGGKRASDVLTVTYKNLGSANELGIFFVVAYRDDEGGLTYSGSADGSVGQYRTCIRAKLAKNMSESDGWRTFTVNLAEATKGTDGSSEWGDADILCLFRIDSYPGNIADNDILIKDVSFSAA